MDEVAEAYRCQVAPVMDESNINESITSMHSEKSPRILYPFHPDRRIRMEQVYTFFGSSTTEQLRATNLCKYISGFAYI